MFKRFVIPCVLICLFCVFALPHMADSASSAAALLVTHPDSGQSVTVPADATPEQIKDIMAGLSDTQVRSLLIEELKREAAAATPAQPGPQGIAGFVQRLREGGNRIRDRFEYLFSGASVAPRELPNALQVLISGDQRLSAGQVVLGLAVLSALWLGAMYLFRRKTAAARLSIAQTPADALWYTRMGRLFLRALLDFFGLVLILAVVFTCYLVLFGEEHAAKPVIVAWVTAMVFLELVKLVGRFLLAPQAPNLRYLPLSDGVAEYLFTWLCWLARIMAVGLLITTLIRLQGGSEALFLLVTTCFGFFMTFILMLLVLWNKKRVADAIRARSQAQTVVFQFANVWHMAAITYLLAFFMFWVLSLMVLGGKAMVPGLLTLLFVPIVLTLDWATQRLVAFAADSAGPNMPAQTGDEDAELDENGDELEYAGPFGKHAGKFQSFLSKGFRAVILAGAVFSLLHVWGFPLNLGRAVIHAAFETLVTLVLAYIVWVFVSRFIERKLRVQTADGHGGHEGGGPGGDRFSTLLQLLKKFLFISILVITILIILSSLGVDIGPLIAGASVFGIAIGFGSQTLVKDIISGIFFLTDDAFRVGDYIETGGAMGTVEEIGVRSLKLRHHLGFLYTIPFGSMKMVKNNTRDWAVMKLKYLVPFDTDIGQVKKIIKKINKEVRAVPELDAMMLADIKSQGVKAMEEYGMRMRVKFMTKPGGQFTLRKLVLAKMRKYFAEAGIEFARPRVSVHIPDGADMSDEERAHMAAGASSVVEKKKKDAAAKKDHK